MIAWSDSKFRRIKEFLKDKATLLYLHFAVYLAASLILFLKMFERDEPLVHIMSDKVNEVTHTCLRMFLKVDMVGEKERADLVAIHYDK